MENANQELKGISDSHVIYGVVKSGWKMVGRCNVLAKAKAEKEGISPSRVFLDLLSTP